MRARIGRAASGRDRHRTIDRARHRAAAFGSDTRVQSPAAVPCCSGELDQRPGTYYLLEE